MGWGLANHGGGYNVIYAQEYLNSSVNYGKNYGQAKNYDMNLKKILSAFYSILKIENRLKNDGFMTFLRLFEVQN